MRFNKKNRSASWKVILLLVVYIFTNLTNLFFVERYTRNTTNNYTHVFVAKRKIKNMFRLQKAANTTLAQSKTSANEAAQRLVQFFIALLFVAGILVIAKKLFPPSNLFLPDYQYAFLRYRSIQI